MVVMKIRITMFKLCMNKLSSKVITLLSVVVLLAGCSPAAAAPAVKPAVEPTPVPTATQTLIPTPVATATTAPQYLWISRAVPAELRKQAESWGLPVVLNTSIATAMLDFSSNQAETRSTWVYALVAAFPTVTDGLTFAQLQAAWSGSLPKPFTGHPLAMDATTFEVMEAILGEPAQGAVRVITSEGVREAVLHEAPTLAIIPFEEIIPSYKVLTIDGQSPLRNDFDQAVYPLKAGFACQGVDCGELASTNRDPSKMTVLVMTGSTALVRATAVEMEKRGVLFPAQDVGDMLRAADILHISNEIPFADNCPPPKRGGPIYHFCSDPKNIQLLESIGTDVVEMTGNHFQDYGSAAARLTVEMYSQRGWPHFGGGANLVDAQSPALLEHNGNKFAFIGCNPVGPAIAWATETEGGAADCDDFKWITAEVSRLRAEGYIPIVTFQYQEYYTPPPRFPQQRDFRMMADAGAVIVSGSQSHTPQAMEFYDGAFIHYGLGNIFFDQMYTGKDTRRAFIDRHVFYDGRYIGTELITTMLEDYARPRYMTPAERKDLLEYIFGFTDWTF
jgi:hypothetical protein